jgi:hypothetical protein
MTKKKVSAEKSVKKIYDLAEYRKKSGRDAFHADWQAVLEVILLMMQEPLLDNPGKLLSMNIREQQEWEFYLEVQRKLDLPPNAYGVLMSPSAFEYLSSRGVKKALAMKRDISKPRDAYSIIITKYSDHSNVMQVSLPGIESIGIDVFEVGKHFADFTYNSIVECLDDLSNVVWSFFRPVVDWTDEMVKLYTDNWVSKDIDLIDLGNANIHSEYSYLHNPELLDLTPQQTFFLATEAAVTHEYKDLEDAIKMANDINQDMNFGYAVITEEGILNDKKDECQALFSRIVVEVDMSLEGLQYVDGVKMPKRNIKDKEYNKTFRKSVQNIYKTITGRECLSGLKL